MSMFLLGPPPFFWSGLAQESASISAPPPLAPTQETPPIKPVDAGQQQEFAGGLTVYYDSFSIDDETGIATMRGNVRAVYGVTEIRCEELQVIQETKELKAIGKVEVIDPDGTLTCEELWATWEKPPEGATQEELDLFVLGRASNAEARIGNAHFRAAEIIVHPGLWEMLEARGTISSRDDAPYGLFARRVMLRPGKGGVAERLYLEIFGQKLGPIPRYTFTLDRRLANTGFPSIRQDRERGLGVGWAFNRLINDHSAVYGGYESFPGIAPKYSFEYAFSPLEPESSTAKINPRSDLGERFSDGWFDNIDTPDRHAEQGELRRERLSYSIGTRWNETAGARLVDGGEISKALDIVYERGGEWKGFGTMFQGRLQYIRGDAEESFVARALLHGTALAPDYSLADNIFIRTRGDLFLTQSKNGTYSWFRGSAGLIFEPGGGFTVGAAYVSSFDFGRPDFEFDPLYSRHAAHFRFDWKSGPYTVKYLYKFDLDRGEWYDREWEVSLVADAFEPFIQYRQDPSDYKIGIRFRIDNFADKITSRDPSRNRRKN